METKFMLAENDEVIPETEDVCEYPGCGAPATHGVHGFVSGVLISHNACASHKLGWNNGDPEDEFAKARLHPSD
jgi:hypothetical protein